MDAIPLSHDMIILRAYEARFGAPRRFDTWKLPHAWSRARSRRARSCSSTRFH